MGINAACRAQAAAVDCAAGFDAWLPGRSERRFATTECLAVQHRAGFPAERCPSGLRSTPGKCVYGLTPYRGFESLPLRHFSNHVNVYGGPVGASATIGRKLRQVRKEATVSTDRKSTRLNSSH